MPAFVNMIVGYSQTTGRMYLMNSENDALMSTLDGANIDLTKVQPVVKRSVVVPGDIAVRIPSITWGDYQGTTTSKTVQNNTLDPAFLLSLHAQTTEDFSLRIFKFSICINCTEQA